MRQEQIKRADGRKLTVVSKELSELPIDKRLAALEAESASLAARLAKLEKQKNPA